MVINTLKEAIDLTPSALYLPEDRCASSLVALDGNVYLATCQFSSEKTTIICTVYRYDDKSALWQNLKQLIFPIEVDLAAKKPLQCKIFALHTDEGIFVLAWFLGSFSSQVLVSLSGEKFRVINIPAVDKGLIIQQVLYGEGCIYLLLTYPEEDSGRGQSEIVRLPAPLREPLAQWETVPFPLKAAKADQAITKLAFWNHRIYALISNLISGFELWCLDLDTEEWRQALRNGLERYSLNPKISSITVFNENLYLSTGLIEESRYLDTFELACIYPNYDWDLIIGTPRFTSIGIRVPLFFQGLGSKSKTYQLVRLITHRDALYLCCQSIEGLELWSSTDGIDWAQLTIFNLNQYLYIQLLEIFSSSSGLLLLCETQNVAGVSQRRLLLCC